jgi:hypothetical protein
VLRFKKSFSDICADLVADAIEGTENLVTPYASAVGVLAGQNEKSDPDADQGRDREFVLVRHFSGGLTSQPCR